MSDPFIAEIKIFGGNYAPSGYAFCNGQVLPIQQNTALYALIGTIYGGDGKTNFALPNLQGRAPMHPGSGPGLTRRTLGQTGGAATVTLTANQSPSHTHQAVGSSENGRTNTPGASVYVGAGENMFGPAQSLTPMASASLTSAGSPQPQPHNNMQPHLAMNFIIALQGIFPPRS